MTLVPFPRRREPVTAGSPHPSQPWHVIVSDDVDDRRTRCGADVPLVMRQRAHLVRPSDRCAADGCYQAWPPHPDEVTFDRTLRSAWGRRRGALQLRPDPLGGPRA